MQQAPSQPMRGVDPNTGIVPNQTFDVKRKQVKNIQDQLKLVMDSILESNKQISALTKNNLTLEKQFRGLVPQGDMQFEEAVTIADCHAKEKAVLNDTEVAMKTLQLNFQKWYNEYNVLDCKLKIRDQYQQKIGKAANEPMRQQALRDFSMQ